MIHFCTPESGRVMGDGGWFYLGKDTAVREALEKLLEIRPLPLKGLLHEETARLKRPFLDLVSALGAGQKNAPAWWAGTLAWKDWSASDLFLLVCYESLCRRLAGSPQLLGTPNPTVVLEDPWLFHQVRGMLERRPGVSFSPPPPLKPLRVKAAFLGAARRLRWAWRTLRSRTFQSFVSLGRRPDFPSKDGVLIYSHVLERSLPADGGWLDHCLPGLDRELEAAGASVRRCTYSDNVGHEKALARRHSYVAPSILYGSLRGLLRSFISLPPALPPEAQLDGMPVGLLLEREWWNDLSRAGRCAFLFFLDAARRLLALGSWKTLVLPWEAQPQERLLVLAAREKGLRVVGYQHAPFSGVQLTNFLGTGEAERAPLPDVLFTSGEEPLRAMAECGLPPERLRLGGSRRFAYLLSSNGARPTLAPETRSKVLVILPIDSFQSRHLLSALGRAYPKGGKGFELVVQPHPAEPETAAALKFPAQIVHTPLAQTLKSCGLVVFTGSTSGLEAWGLGHPVLRYRPDSLVDIDPCDLFDEDTLPTAGDADLAEKIEALREAGPPPREALDAALKRLFAPVDPQAWRQAILD